MSDNTFLITQLDRKIAVLDKKMRSLQERISPLSSEMRQLEHARRILKGESGPANPDHHVVISSKKQEYHQRIVGLMTSRPLDGYSATQLGREMGLTAPHTAKIYIDQLVAERKLVRRQDNLYYLVG